METQIGQISHFYDHIKVVVLLPKGKLNVGDKIHVLGPATDFVKEVTSMEIEHKKVTTVSPGDKVALKVNEPVKVGDVIYKISEEPK